MVTAANGLSIHYLGYIELDIELCGQVISNCGGLVVRDPPGGLCDQIRELCKKFTLIYLHIIAIFYYN